MLFRHGKGSTLAPYTSQQYKVAHWPQARQSAICYSSVNFCTTLPNTRATIPNNTMSTTDAEAPLPFVREKSDFIPETVKFEYEYEVASTRTITKQRPAAPPQPGAQADQPPSPRAAQMLTEIVTETIREKKSRKATLKMYERTTKEDSEHFFECFEKLQKELAPIWDQAKRAMRNDATVLFDGFEHMLTGTANSQWHDVLTDYPGRTWEDFKKAVATYICTKVLPDDAYDRQVSHMTERMKPKGLTAKDWWLRMQTMNRYLPYFFPSMDKLKEEVPNATFPDWWIEGNLSGATLKRIVMHKIPRTWQNSLKLNDIGHEYRDKKSTNDLIDYFTTLEDLEKSHQARITPRGRGNGPRNQMRNNYGRGPTYRPRGNNNPVRYDNNNNPVRFNNYGSNYPRRQTNYPPRAPGSYPNQGGRGRGPTFGRNNGRFGGLQGGRGRFQPSQGRGGFTGQQFGQQHQRPEAYSQEEIPESEPDQPSSELNTEQADEQFVDMAEFELEQAWNEQLFLEEPDEVYEEDEEEDNYYGEDEYYQNNDAAYGGYGV